MENNLALIGIGLVPLILTGIFLRPEVLLYYLVLDSWVIMRISQVTFFHPALTLNRIMVYFGVLIIIFKRLLDRNLIPKAAKSIMTLFVTIFLLYCFYSYYSYTRQFNFAILNNLVFYFLALALLDMDFEKSFRHICIIALIPVVLLSGTTIINMVLHMDIGQRSYAGNRNSSAFYTLLGTAFLFAFRYILDQEKLKRIAVNGIIFVAIITIGLSLGRMVTFILFLTIGFYFLRGYIPLKVLIAAGLMVAIIAASRFELVDVYTKKLLRLPTANADITKYNQEEMTAFTSGRSEAYKAAWKLYLASPVLGIGYDRWVQMHKGQKGSSLHSQWLQCLVETGIPGFLLYLSLYLIGFISLFAYFFKNSQSRGMPIKIVETLFVVLMGFFFVGLTGNHGFNNRIFYLFLAMIATLANYNQAAAPTELPSSSPTYAKAD